MNILKNIAFFCLLFASCAAHAQSIERSVIGTLGGSTTAGGGGPQLMYNVGEPATATLTGTASVVTQGFEQPGVTLPPIAGIMTVCANAATSLTDAVAGGIWSSSNTSIAVVNNSGMVTGISAGPAVITYAVPGSLVTASVTVNALYPIIASAGSNGSISPSGITNVCAGGSQVYSITPYPGYHIQSVLVDGSNVGALTVYTFTSVATSHTISTTFAIDCAAPLITSAASVSGITCHGGSNGAVATYISGSAPLAYTWSTGATTPGLSGISAGTYTYTVTNTCGSVSGSAVVSEPPALTATLTTTSSACGGVGGSVNAVISGGTPGYTYLWNNGATTSGMTGIATGTYSVSVTDIHGCTVAGSATVTPGERTVTVRLVSSTGTGISGGDVQYYNGSWVPMGSTDANGYVCMSFPTPAFSGTFTTYFRVLYAGGTQQWSGIAVASSPVLVATTTNVSVALKDHTGTLITSATGTAGYYPGSWTSIGSTGSTGYVSKELLPGSYYFNMNYNNYTAQQNITIGSGPSQTVNFQTTLVTLDLLNHNGSLITAESGTGGYYSGGWYTIGSTGSTGTVSMELLPGSGYYFNMNYHNYTQQQAVTVISEPVQNVNFQTTLVTLNLLDHTSALITAESGTGGYYSGGWYTIGATGSTGSIAMELLPGSGYYFNMNYHNYTQQQSVTVISEPVQNVNFQTTLVTLNLLDHLGALITPESGTGGYYSGGWYTIGSTGTTGSVSMELLPGSGYYFNMNYHNYTQQQAVTVISEPVQNVNFQATLVILNLLDHTGALITAESGTGGYYSGGWYTMGSTGTTGSVSMELLPGSGYYFNMNYHNYTQQQAVTVISGPLQNVNFQTTLVTLNLLDHTGSLITAESGTGGYYAGSWYTMGSTGSAGSVSMEMLPGPGYYFNMNYHNYTQQQAVTVTSGPAQAVIFRTTLVTLKLLNHSGSLITAEAASGGYYTGGWYTIGSTGSLGTVAVELLPGSGYYFNMNYHNGTQQVGSMTVNGDPWTQAVAFQAALVTIHYQRSSGTPVTGGSIGYYNGGWYTLGTSDGSGNAAIEMLPVSYYYNAAATGLPIVQVGPFTDAATGTPTHVIIAKSSGAKTTHTDSTDAVVTNDVAAEQAKISIYPNPTNDQVNVVIPSDYGEADIIIADMAGKILQQRHITDNKGIPVLFSLGDMAKGFYAITVKSADITYTAKVIVQ